MQKNQRNRYHAYLLMPENRQKHDTKRKNDKSGRCRTGFIIGRKRIQRKIFYMKCQKRELDVEKIFKLLFEGQMRLIKIQTV